MRSAMYHQVCVLLKGVVVGMYGDLGVIIALVSEHVCVCV